MVFSPPLLFRTPLVMGNNTAIVPCDPVVYQGVLLGARNPMEFFGVFLFCFGVGVLLLSNYLWIYISLNLLVRCGSVGKKTQINILSFCFLKLIKLISLPPSLLLLHFLKFYIVLISAHKVYLFFLLSSPH